MKDNLELFKFINDTPNAFFCTKNIKRILKENGFKELFEGNVWNNLNKDGKYFVSRNDSSIIAFKLTNNPVLSFNITASHTDSPAFNVKTNPEMFENGYLKLNTESYGGMINYSWLDRPLSIAGRVITKKGNDYKKQIINIEKDLLVIPSQAIHINRDVNIKNELNHQIDMLPIISLSKEKNINNLISDFLIQKGESFDKICDYDLYLYNRDNAKYIGINEDFILSPRLDDLGSLFPALNGFIDSYNNDSINLFCAFNNEEIGSLTSQGADSTFLIDILSRIANALNIDLLTTLSNSFVVSADNAHATHPNAASKSDPTNKVKLNEGIVIKHHTNYTTDSITSSLFKGICDNVNVPYQDFACKSDMRCGSTLGGISQSHVSIDSIDIGIPQLAMHSSNELIGSKDVLYMYKALLEFYNSSFIKENDTIKIKRYQK